MKPEQPNSLKYLKGILPIIESLHGWGDTSSCHIEVTDVNGRDEVTRFTLTKPEVHSAGYVLVFRSTQRAGLWTYAPKESTDDLYLIQL